MAALLRGFWHMQADPDRTPPAAEPHFFEGNAPHPAGLAGKGRDPSREVGQLGPGEHGGGTSVHGVGEEGQ